MNRPKCNDFLNKHHGKTDQTGNCPGNPTKQQSTGARHGRRRLTDVQRHGDAAVRDYSARFDKWSPASFKLSPSEIKDLMASLPTQVIEDIQFAQHRCATLPRSSVPHCTMSKSRPCPASPWATKTSGSTASAAMCQAAVMPWFLGAHEHCHRTGGWRQTHHRLHPADEGAATRSHRGSNGLGGCR